MLRRSILIGDFYFLHFKVMHTCDTPDANNCSILNQGLGAWALEEHAERLSRALNIDVSESPRDYNYLLAWDGEESPSGKLFIPFDAVQIASDKRLQAKLFNDRGVAIPETILVETPETVRRIITTRSDIRWCLKYPTSCGASGHRLLKPDTEIPIKDWPLPYIVQEFIPSDQPSVYRTYAANGECFGWNVRKFPEGKTAKPWVAHAQGARYEILEEAPPPKAKKEARLALEVCGLIGSFGCADLLFDTRRNLWMILEVGTDGLYNHVDRDIGNDAVAREIDRRIGSAFWAWVGKE